MLKEQKLQQLKGDARKLRQFLHAGETPPLAFLQELCDLVESVTLDAGLVSDECKGYQETHDWMVSGLAALSALGSFRAQETVPEQWAIEHRGVVVASGASLIEAAHNLDVQRLKSSDLASVASNEL